MGRYLLTVCAVCILTALLQAAAPGKQAGRSLKFAGGLLILLVVIGPLAGLRTGDLSELVQAAAALLPEVQETGTADSTARISELITDRCSAYIWDKAEALGMSVAVELRLSADDGWPSPSGVVLRGRWTGPQQQALADILETELGIPRQEQEWQYE